MLTSSDRDMSAASSKSDMLVAGRSVVAENANCVLPSATSGSMGRLGRDGMCLNVY